MIWVIGSKGMLGAELCDQLRNNGQPFCESDRDVSILDLDALRKFVRERPVRTIVNCAAYTAVDRAESEKDAAFALNADGPGNIATVANEIGARIIHLSTDYVFPGDIDRPLREDDRTGPAGVYGFRNYLAKPVYGRNATTTQSSGPHGCMVNMETTSFLPCFGS